MSGGPPGLNRPVRRRAVVVWAVLALAGILLAAAGPVPGAGSRIAYSVELTGTIDPATQAWLARSLQEAERRRAEVVILRIDTPGGLDTAMRAMIKRMIAAPMPVIAYVSPDGARAASAGLFITQAADVAAMAPQTNIGSATPVSIGPGPQDEVLGRKVRNDAAAYVRALAEGHGRNPDLAEEMVRKATNVTARRALEAGLIDVVAANEAELLRKLDGFRVRGGKARRLDTSGLRVERADMSFGYELQQVLVNPTIAVLLLLAGLGGLAFELLSPGAIAPGAFGAVALVLGLYGTAQLPVTAAGVVLLLVAVALFVAEAHVASHGVLGIAAVIALVAGLLLLFDTDSEAFRVSVPVALLSGALLGALTLFAVSKALGARRLPVLGGHEELVGQVGTVRVPLDPVGQVFVHGALWRARALEPAGVVEAGARVRVESVDGLTLAVRPAGEPAERATEHLSR